MFVEAGSPGFFKIVNAVRKRLLEDKRFQPISQFGNPLIFEAARIWVWQYGRMTIVGGEEWAWDKMVHKYFDDSIGQSIVDAYNRIVERIGEEIVYGKDHI